MAVCLRGFESTPSLVLDDMIPIGGIINYFGLFADIPAGWALCDGSNGTPDMHNNFVRGTTEEVAIGAGGGNDLHTHAFGIVGHDHSVTTLHDCPGGGGIEAWSAGVDGKVTEETELFGSTQTASNTPPFIVLAYIMRIS
jgi:hypothetical protein